MDPYLGEIRMFGGNFAPLYWALCQGQLVSIQSNTALFSLLGTYYGGNGTSTFALPDLRGRCPIAPGQGPGLSYYVLGEQAGSETVSLVSSEAPSHSHAFNAVSDVGTTVTAAGNQLATISTGGNKNLTYGGRVYSTAGPLTALPATAMSVVGGGAAHPNRMPYLGINFIICTSGIFPPRSNAVSPNAKKVKNHQAKAGA